MLDSVINTAIQVGVVLIIALIVWLIWGRRVAGFGRYVGLYGAPWSVVALAAVLGLASAAALLALPGLREMAGGERTVAGELAAGGVGHGVIAALIITAIFKTAFSEELLFRGLIGKRLIAWLGFGAGNAIQAVLFGAVHLLLLLSPQATAVSVASLVAATTVMGWVSGWLNEKKAGGSILPSWAMHATANLGSYLFLALSG